MRKLLAVSALFVAQSVMSAPFDSCSPQAYLTQGKVPQTFSINLVSGEYRIETSDMGTRETVNGTGFNPEDNYIYGWGYESGAPVRIHNNFQIEKLDVKNITNKNFYVGDVHPFNNKYYVYRSGVNYGLYSIQLDSAAADYLQMTRIIDGRALSLNAADMAINPADGLAYTVSSSGILTSISLDDGAHSELGDIGEKGSFGAAYFDPNGNMYIGRNSDGAVFRMAIGSGDYTAELLFLGPASNTNDGARCALATIEDIAVAKMDFGDAPDSYGSYLESDGARHGIGDSSLYLGEWIDVESDGSVYPLSDDANGGSDEDDGIQFATDIIGGQQSVAIVSASASGYLSAWIDLSGDGAFDVDDQLLTDVLVTGGKQAIYIDIPATLVEGKTWARFRLSSEPGLQSTGVAVDGEVEDYQVALQSEEVIVNHYPSATDWTTLAFEDNWPLEGDYDMNDLVVYMKTAIASTDSGVKKVSISGEVAAVGAAYHNGFAVRLPGVKASQVDLDNVKYTINGKSVSYSAIEEGREEAILMVTYNIWDFVGTGELCLFYRTEAGCGSAIEMKFEAEIPMLEPVEAELRGVLDPFLFATPGAWHGGHFVSAPGRSYEIHLKNQAPTEAFDSTLYDQQGDDVSDPGRDTYFQTSNGLPWALEIGTRWDYPIEYRDISHAYHLFSQYASSGGLKNTYWYNPEQSSPELIFSN